jgi:hypothetical protein
VTVCVIDDCQEKIIFIGQIHCGAVGRFTVISITAIIRLYAGIRFLMATVLGRKS